MTVPASPPLRVTILAGGGLGPVAGGVGTMLGSVLGCWAARPAAPLASVIDTRGGPGRIAGIVAFLAALARLAWLCAARRTDVVHAHMTTRGSVWRKTLLCSLARALGTPVVIHMHGADFADFYRSLHPWPRAWLADALRHAQRVVVLGEGWRDFLVQQAGVAPARIAIVLNGVAMPPPRPPRAPGPPRILFLGRIGARKGVPELLAALATPPLRALAWQATIAGDGEQERFAATGRDLGLQDRLVWPGWVDRPAIQALLAQADMLVLPSHHEALPMAVIEALAHGVAVLATPVGATAELLTDGVHAVLVPPGDVAALARALTYLLDDAELRARLGRAGHAVFLARLQADATATQLLAVFHQAVAQGRRRLARLRPSLAGP